MSAEKIINIKVNDLPSLANLQKKDKILPSGRVDINILLDRAREKKKKKTRINLVFAGLTLCLIFTVGLILSF